MKIMTRPSMMGCDWLIKCDLYLQWSHTTQVVITVGYWPLHIESHDWTAYSTLRGKCKKVQIWYPFRNSGGNMAMAKARWIILGQGLVVLIISNSGTFTHSAIDGELVVLFNWNFGHYICVDIMTRKLNKNFQSSMQILTHLYQYLYANI